MPILHGNAAVPKAAVRPSPPTPPNDGTKKDRTSTAVRSCIEFLWLALRSPRPAGDGGLRPLSGSGNPKAAKRRSLAALLFRSPAPNARRAKSFFDRRRTGAEFIFLSPRFAADLLPRGRKHARRRPTALPQTRRAAPSARTLRRSSKLGGRSAALAQKPRKSRAKRRLVRRRSAQGSARIGTRVFFGKDGEHTAKEKSAPSPSRRTPQRHIPQRRKKRDPLTGRSLF